MDLLLSSHMYHNHPQPTNSCSMATSTSMTASCVVILVWSPESLPQKSPKKNNSTPWNWRGGRPINEIPIRGKTTLRVTAAPDGLSCPNQLRWLFAVPKPIFKHQPRSWATLLHSFPALPAHAAFSRSNLGLFFGGWFGQVSSHIQEISFRWNFRRPRSCKSPGDHADVYGKWFVDWIESPRHPKWVPLPCPCPCQRDPWDDKKNHGGFLLHIFSWIFLGTTVMTQSQQQKEICCFWAMLQVSWVQNDHSYRPGFVMGFFCFSKSMRLLEPKWLVFWFSKGLFLKGCLRVPGCALHQGSIHPKSQVSPEGTWKLRLRTRISQSDSFSLLRRANLPRLKHPCKSEVERIGEAKHFVVGLFPLAPLPTGLLHV